MLDDSAQHIRPPRVVALATVEEAGALRSAVLPHEPTAVLERVASIEELAPALASHPEVLLLSLESAGEVAERALELAADPGQPVLVIALGKSTELPVFDVVSFEDPDRIGRSVKLAAGHARLQRRIKRSDLLLTSSELQIEGLAALGQEALEGCPQPVLTSHAAHLVMRALGADHVEHLGLAPDNASLVRIASASISYVDAGRADDGTPRDAPIPLSPDGIIAKVIANAREAAVDDASAAAHALHAPFSTAGYLTSLLVVPLGAQRRVSGVLLIARRTPRAFRREESRFAFAVANILDAAARRMRDAAALRQTEQQLATSLRVTQILAEATDTRAAFPQIAGAMSGPSAWGFAALWTVDRPAGHLHCTHVWAPQPTFPELEKLSRQVRLATGEDLPGRVWSSGNAEWSRDLAGETNSARTALASSEGLHAAFAFPIRRKGEIWGVMELMSREVLAPDATLVTIGAGLGTQIGNFMERRWAEEQLQHAQKMEAVGRLAGGIAHDFNNLLVVILGYAELGLERLNTADPLHAELELIQASAQRAAQLTRQLLAFSRKQALQPRVVDLKEAILEMARMLPRVLGEDIRLATRLPVEVQQVFADPGQISQVIMNLATNARDAMPRGGTLEIGMRREHVSAQHRGPGVDVPAGDYVVLWMADNGCGMDAATRSMIFEPFFSTKGRLGTGLGLSTVFGIVKQSGGDIQVESEVGRGTTFRVYLPVATDATPRPVSTPGRRLPTGETILVVEDQQDVRVLTALILERAGYRVLVAAGDADAVEVCQSETGPIHALLVDVVLAQGTGPEVAGKLLRLRPELKVLFMSGYTDDNLDRLGLTAEQMPLLSKPFSAAGLSRRIREVLDGPPGWPQAAATTR